MTVRGLRGRTNATSSHFSSIERVASFPGPIGSQYDHSQARQRSISRRSPFPKSRPLGGSCHVLFISSLFALGPTPHCRRDRRRAKMGATINMIPSKRPTPLPIRTTVLRFGLPRPSVTRSIVRSPIVPETMIKQTPIKTNKIAPCIKRLVRSIVCPTSAGILATTSPLDLSIIAWQPRHFVNR
jgi:hypothetical protein